MNTLNLTNYSQLAVWRKEKFARNAMDRLPGSEYNKLISKRKDDSHVEKLIALSLSLLLCLSLLPSQAGAMDDSKDESPVQAEDMENPGSPEDGDAGIAPCTIVAWADDGNSGPGLPVIRGDQYGNTQPYGPADPPPTRP